MANIKAAASICQIPDPNITATLNLLAEAFPLCFAIYEKRRQPLKVGIHHDILAKLDGAITPAELSRGLRVYTANRVYRSRLILGAARIDLDGQPAGAVTADQVPTKKPKATAAAALPKRISLADLREAAKRRRENTEAVLA